MPKEKQNPCYQITRSYSENFQHQYEGGKMFEKSDLFASHSYSFYKEPTDKQIEEMSNLLFLKALTDVKNAIEDLKALMRIRNSDKQKEEKALDFGLEIQEDADDDRKDFLNKHPEEIKKEIKSSHKDES